MADIKEVTRARSGTRLPNKTNRFFAISLGGSQTVGQQLRSGEKEKENARTPGCLYGVVLITYARDATSLFPPGQIQFTLDLRDRRVLSQVNFLHLADATSDSSWSAHDETRLEENFMREFFVILNRIFDI